MIRRNHIAGPPVMDDTLDKSIDKSTDQSIDDRRTDACLPIRTVSAETGVNAITLRAWERRYGLIRPVRTPSGHRLYTRADIELVRRVLLLQDQGVPVSRAIAWLKEHPEQATLPPGRSAAPGDDGNDAPTFWATLRTRMLDAIDRYDDYDLDTAWNDAVDRYPVDVVIRFLLLPVGSALHSQQPECAARRAAVAFWRAFLRNRLGARFVNQSRDAHGTKIVLAAVTAGAELSALLLGIALTQRGLRPMLFSAGTPPADLAEARRRSRAGGIILVADLPPSSGLLQELALMARESGALAGGAVFAGGEGFSGNRERLHAAGVVMLDTDPAAAARLVQDILPAPAHRQHDDG